MMANASFRRLVLAGGILIGVLAAFGPRVSLNLDDFPNDLEAVELAQIKGMDLQKSIQWVEERERKTPHIRPGLESFVQIPDSKEQKPSDRALLYLHGFSASPKEVTPVMETLSRAIGANLFSPRLKAHGQGPEEFATVKARDWIQDVMISYWLTRNLGHKVDVIGTSTGGTLALWLAHQSGVKIDHLVLMSPNLGPRVSSANLALVPWGESIVRAVLGPYWRWKPSSPLQESRWTTTVRSEAIPQMMSLVDFVRTMPLKPLAAQCLLIFNPDDPVVSVPKIESFWKRLECSRKMEMRIENSKAHVLAGEAVASSSASQKIQSRIQNFLVGN